MPPPIISLSTLGSRLSITSILPLILAPPSTATKGRTGLFTAPSRYWISFSMSKPETAVETNPVTPCVEAWAR